MLPVQPEQAVESEIRGIQDLLEFVVHLALKVAREVKASRDLPVCEPSVVAPG